MKKHELIIAGFGGQGVMLLGRLLTYAGMLENKHVSWIPSYGPEMRGGTANCSVIVSEEIIGSPVVAEPTVLIALNKPSLDKFLPKVRPGGSVIINSSIITANKMRGDIAAYQVPMNDLAQQCGNARALNMVAMGALIALTDIIYIETLQGTLEKNFKNNPETITANIQAVRRGMSYIHQNSTNKSCCG